MIKVLVVDDHPLLRDAIRRKFELESGIEVVGEAGGAEEALALTEETKPALVILDLSLKGEVDGVELCRRFKALSDPPLVLVYSAYNDPGTLAACRAAGADGYLHKEDPSWFMKVAKEVAAGKKIWLEGDEPEESFGAREDDPLTPREREVHNLILRGYTNPQIARKLRIAERTVKTHAGNVFKKLDKKGREDLLDRS